jgi:hypothetical protein
MLLHIELTRKLLWPWSKEDVGGLLAAVVIVNPSYNRLVTDKGHRSRSVSPFSRLIAAGTSGLKSTVSRCLG